MITPLPQMDGRVPTGAVRFGHDWPGYYMQGDRSWWFIQLLEFAKKHLDEKYHEAYDELIKDLRTCTVTSEEYKKVEAEFHEMCKKASG